MEATQHPDRKLVGKDTCLASLFAEDSRPSPRTFDTWKRQRVIPYVKIGRMCFYDVEAVRAALDSHFTVRPRSECRA